MVGHNSAKRLSTATPNLETIDNTLRRIRMWLLSILKLCYNLCRFVQCMPAYLSSTYMKMTTVMFGYILLMIIGWGLCISDILYSNCIWLLYINFTLQHKPFLLCNHVHTCMYNKRIIFVLLLSIQFKQVPGVEWT